MNLLWLLLAFKFGRDSAKRDCDRTSRKMSKRELDWRIDTGLTVCYSYLVSLLYAVTLFTFGGGFDRALGPNLSAFLVVSISVFAFAVCFIFEALKLGGVSNAGFVWSIAAGVSTAVTLGLMWRFDVVTSLAVRVPLSLLPPVVMVACTFAFHRIALILRKERMR